MTDDNRGVNALTELGRAEVALEEAEALAGLGLSDGAASRAYYAAFHAASALLLLEGDQPRTHRGVHALLEKRLVATGVLDAVVLACFARLQERRSVADYGLERHVTAGEIPALLSDARAVIAAARHLVAR